MSTLAQYNNIQGDRNLEGDLFLKHLRGYFGSGKISSWMVFFALFDSIYGIPAKWILIWKTILSLFTYSVCDKKVKKRIEKNSIVNLDSRILKYNKNWVWSHAHGFYWAYLNGGKKLQSYLFRYTIYSWTRIKRSEPEVETRAHAASSMSWAMRLSSRLLASEVATSDIGSWYSLA